MQSSVLDILFNAISRETLEQYPSTIYTIDADFRLVYTNPAWDDFARANNGARVTSDRLDDVCVIDVISQPLQRFYTNLYTAVLQEGATLEHVYQCSSADLYRTFHMQLLPLPSRAGVVTIHALTTSERHQAPAAAPDHVVYEVHGMITMCSHCRRTQQVGSKRWDWVPAFVRQQPTNITHGLCTVCLEYYYTGTDARRRLRPGSRLPHLTLKQPLGR